MLKVLSDGGGHGSIQYSFDVTLDDKSNVRAILSPFEFNSLVQRCAFASGMSIRCKWLDAWPNGAATAVRTFEESHISGIVLPIGELVAETWPERRTIIFDARLCHYSKDNTRAAQRLVLKLIEELHPASVRLVGLHRAPGPFAVEDLIDWSRGDNLQFETDHGIAFLPGRAGRSAVYAKA